MDYTGARFTWLPTPRGLHAVMWGTNGAGEAFVALTLQVYTYTPPEADLNALPDARGAQGIFFLRRPLCAVAKRSAPTLAYLGYLGATGDARPAEWADALVEGSANVLGCFGLVMELGGSAWPEWHALPDGTVGIVADGDRKVTLPGDEPRDG